ncbi:MAG: VWA domain-containing protein [Candidatus Methanomethylicaceae archaeon]
MLDALVSVDLKKLCLDADIIDTSAFEGQLAEQEPLREAFAHNDERLAIGADLFTALYRLRPRLKEDPPAPVRAQVLSAVMETSAYQKLHAMTALDDVLSAGATLALKRYLEEREKEILEALERESEALHAEDLAQELAQDAPQQAQALQEQASQLREQAQQALQKKNLKQRLRAAMTSAQQVVENAAACAAAWGHEPGVLQELLFNPDITKLLSTQKLQRILALAGRMREVIAAERAKRPLPAPDQVDIVLGNDVLNLVPSELALLSDPELEDIFYRKYVENALLQFKRIEKPRLGKGPFVVCIDESGSMQGPREEWAKALALALMTQARAEGRRFGVVCFGSRSEVRSLFDPKPSELLPFLNRFYGGGTDFEAPLAEAIRLIQHEDHDADVIFVTDGEAAVSKEFLVDFHNARERLGFKVLGVQVGEGGLDGMKPFCDSVFRLIVQNGTAGLEAVIQEIGR